MLCTLPELAPASGSKTGPALPMHVTAKDKKTKAPSLAHTFVVLDLVRVEHLGHGLHVRVSAVRDIIE